jgi:hypothetical protein
MWRNRVQRVLTERLPLLRQFAAARSSSDFSVSGFANAQPDGQPDGPRTYKYLAVVSSPCEHL